LMLVFHLLDYCECIAQGSHKPGKHGKPGIAREFCKPGKVRKFAIMFRDYFMRCRIFRELLI